MGFPTVLGDRRESCDLTLLGEPPERLHLDLADAFTHDPHSPADLLERLRILVACEWQVVERQVAGAEENVVGVGGQRLSVEP